MRPASLGLWALASVAAACGPAPVPLAQVLLFIDTDAPLPAAGLGPDALTLFDRLDVAVYAGEEAAPCEGCVREFSLKADRPRELSLGVAVSRDSAVARVRIYAQRNLDRNGQPDELSSLVAWVRLPRPAPEEVREVHVTLRVADLARPRGGRFAPLEPAVEAPSPPLARWSEARRVPCALAVGPEEACIPGGVVWMGDAQRTPGPAGGLAPRLVSMSPFVLDREEVTVRAFRQSGLATDAHPLLAGSSACTFSATAGPDEDHPVNCVSWATAARFCESRGKELPSEAQLEYVEGGLRGARYPWGDDEPRCAGVTFGRDVDIGPCRTPGRTSPVGTSPQDVLDVPGATLTDLAANVAEWSREAWRGADDACNMPGLFRDPECPVVAASVHATRGGRFSLAALAARSYVREYSSVAADTIGFRCARRR